jgi:hypothetical protein
MYLLSQSNSWLNNNNKGNWFCVKQRKNILSNPNMNQFTMPYCFMTKWIHVSFKSYKQALKLHAPRWTKINSRKTNLRKMYSDFKRSKKILDSSNYLCAKCLKRLKLQNLLPYFYCMTNAVMYIIVYFGLFW